MDLEAQIQDFIAKNVLFTEDGYNYDNDVSFLDQGIVDSMGVLELVMFVGSSFGINVDPVEVTKENFDSVNRLASYIRRKQQELRGSTLLAEGEGVLC
jgi:acyl carrier protein